MLNQVHDGDQVAILPTDHSFPDEVIEIATVDIAGVCIIQLTDGRTYFKDGLGIDADRMGYAVPATERHRAALAAKSQRSVQMA
jgi:hypothetical protein